jgi:hypothetical protein
MLPINSEALAREHPEYRNALRRLISWINGQKDLRFINPHGLAKQLSGVNKSELATALTLLERAGYLRLVYKVLTPNGVLADGEFDDPTKIPERLPDRLEHYFDTSEADVVPIFKMVA